MTHLINFEDICSCLTVAKFSHSLEGNYDDQPVICFTVRIFIVCLCLFISDSLMIFIFKFIIIELIQNFLQFHDLIFILMIFIAFFVILSYHSLILNLLSNSYI